MFRKNTETHFVFIVRYIVSLLMMETILRL